jgi:hypothetical protein
MCQRKRRPLHLSRQHRIAVGWGLLHRVGLLIPAARLLRLCHGWLVGRTPTLSGHIIHQRVELVACVVGDVG